MRALLLAGVAAVGWAGSAHASFINTYVQSGADVVSTGQGTIDLSGLTRGGGASNFALVFPSLPAELSGYGAFSVYRGGITGPSNYGLGNQTLPTFTTGDEVGFGNNGFGGVVVPSTYVSGALLANTATYANATFASLGLNVGTYTYTFGNVGETYTVQIGPAASVPEPASLALLGIGVAGIVAARRRRGLAQGQHA